MSVLTIFNIQLDPPMNSLGNLKLFTKSFFVSGSSLSKLILEEYKTVFFLLLTAGTEYISVRPWVFNVIVLVGSSTWSMSGRSGIRQSSNYLWSHSFVFKLLTNPSITTVTSSRSIICRRKFSSFSLMVCFWKFARTTWVSSL